MIKGLTSPDVQERIINHQTNKMKKNNQKSNLYIIFSHIFTFFNILCFSLAIWLWSIGAYKQTLFMGIIVVNSLISIVQELKAKYMVKKLSLLNISKVTCIRNEVKEEILPEDIVLDDIIYVSKDQQVPVDGIMIQGELEVNEALLTGESVLIMKQVGDDLYSGSYVVTGSGYFKASKVGNDTYIAKLSLEAGKYTEPKSQIFNSLKVIIRSIGLVIVPLGALLFALAYQKNNYQDAVIKTSGALIGMIPSGLFLLTSTALAYSVIKLSLKRVLVQQLYCIEMLARVDCLCLDKTGTITNGNMEVVQVEVIGSYKDVDIYRLMGQFVNETDDTNPTQRALLNYFKDKTNYRILSKTPFSSERKKASMHFEGIGEVSLGALEYVLTDVDIRIKEQINQYQRQGLRVIVLSCRNQVTIPLALIILKDQIRQDIITTITFFKNNDVKLLIISGDDAVTTSAIALSTGVDNAEDYINLDSIEAPNYQDLVKRYAVFGRTKPNQKQMFIEALKNEGYCVAMVGDGVNDILALKASDTSIALASGSDASRQISDIVLLDSNFTYIENIVKEGRRVINNIERVSALFLTKTGFSILLSIFTILFFKTYPFEPIHLTVLSFFSIGFPSFVLAFEPNYQKVSGNFIKNILKKSLPSALSIALVCLLLYELRVLFKIEKNELTSMMFYMTSFILLATLVLISRPLNVFRLMLVSIMILGLVLTTQIFYELFSILRLIDLSLYSQIFLIVVVVFSIPIIIFMSFLIKKIYQFIIKKMKSN